MPRVGSQEEYESRAGGDFGLLPEDSYVFEVTGYRVIGKIPDRFDPEGKKEVTDVRYYAKPIQYADDPETPIADAETGDLINPDKSIQIFFKEEHLGFGPAGPSKNRKFLAAALGVPIKSEIEFEYDQLVGGRFIGDIEHKIKNNKKYDNIVDFRPVKASRERPRPRPQAESAVSAAKEAFGEDLDDDLPF